MPTFLKSLTLAAAFAGLTTGAMAADKYTVDASHAQIIFSWNHLGYSTTYGMFSGFEGEIMFDEADPAASSVTVSMPIKSMFTGWEARDGHLLSPDFFGAGDEDLITFTSTGIEVTGDNTAKITGTLSVKDVSQEVVLETVMNQKGEFPFGPNAGKAWLGFDATTTLSRTAFGVGNFAPAVGDVIEITISIEAGAAE